MNPPTPIEIQILRDLVAGQSTASSTAGRMNMKPPAAMVIMDRLAESGALETHTVAGTLRVYRLTSATREFLSERTKS